MPRCPAQRPWLAEGVSRSTWYRRQKKAREMAVRQAGQILIASFDRTLPARKPSRRRWRATSTDPDGARDHGAGA